MFRKLFVLKVPWKQVFRLLLPDVSSLGFRYKCPVLEHEYKQFYLQNRLLFKRFLSSFRTFSDSFLDELYLFLL